MSRDFFSVSSTLLAVKRAAAAASWGCEWRWVGWGRGAYRPVVVHVVVHQAEFVKINACCVVGTNWPGHLVSF